MTLVWPDPYQLDAYYPPDLPHPPWPVSSLVDRAVAERREEGLPVDPESVRRAVENSKREDYPLPGLFYTPEELAEQDSVDPQLADRAQAILLDAGAEIGGAGWCWIDGRYGVTVSVKHDVERFRELLVEQLGADRVTVTRARYGERELAALLDQIGDDFDELEQLGITFSGLAPEDDTGIEVHYFALDPGHAERVLAARYGEMMVPVWCGASAVAEEPQPFGSWIADGRQLTVYYALPHNGEQFGHCTAIEFGDRVIVNLTILASRGSQTTAGGFKPSHASVELMAPVGDRLVIDAAHAEPRPRWTGKVVSHNPWYPQPDN